MSKDIDGVSYALRRIVCNIITPKDERNLPWEHPDYDRYMDPKNWDVKVIANIDRRCIGIGPTHYATLRHWVARNSQTQIPSGELTKEDIMGFLQHRGLIYRYEGRDKHNSFDYLDPEATAEEMLEFIQKREQKET